jgi:hypothetical protein
MKTIVALIAFSVLLVAWVIWNEPTDDYRKNHEFSFARMAGGANVSESRNIDRPQEE